MRKRRAGKLPDGTTTVLKAWWNAHSKWPYPTVPILLPKPFPACRGLYKLNFKNPSAFQFSLQVVTACLVESNPAWQLVTPLEVQTSW
jgi:hypothetical protein